VLLSRDTLHLADEYVAGYLANDPEGHLTPYEEIKEVPPGHLLRIHHGQADVMRHWYFSSTSRIRHKTDHEYEEHFRHMFWRSVRRRLRSDSPVLAELSGGLDSSSIVCVADDVLVADGTQAPGLDTLSYYDKTEPNGDDWIYLRKIEEIRGKVGFHIDASKHGRSGSLEYGELIPLPEYLGIDRELEAERSEATRRGGHRVVLSGIGGDEFMGGVPDPRVYIADLIATFAFIRLAKQLVSWSLVKRRPALQLLWESAMELLPTRLSQHLAPESRIEPWIKKDFAKRTALATRQMGPRKLFDLWLPTRRSYMAGVFLMGNKKAKAMPRMLTIEENRYPYLDQQLIEFILSIPASQLLRPGERRSLMRRSLAGYVPAEVLSRSTKQVAARGSLLAIANHWEQLRHSFASPLSAQFGYIDRPQFVNTLNSAIHGCELHIVRMLRCISLEYWLRDLVGRQLIESERGSCSKHHTAVRATP